MLAEQFKQETLENWILESAKFYEKYFNQKYNFQKLDIIFIPEYFSTRLENLGNIYFD